jgi:hypothetical protein
MSIFRSEWAHVEKVTKSDIRYENKKTRRRENVTVRIEDMRIRGYVDTIPVGQTVTRLPLHAIIVTGIAVEIEILIEIKIKQLLQQHTVIYPPFLMCLQGNGKSPGTG